MLAIGNSKVTNCGNFESDEIFMQIDDLQER